MSFIMMLNFQAFSCITIGYDVISLDKVLKSL